MPLGASSAPTRVGAQACLAPVGALAGTGWEAEFAEPLRQPRFELQGVGVVAVEPLVAAVAASAASTTRCGGEELLLQRRKGRSRGFVPQRWTSRHGRETRAP